MTELSMISLYSGCGGLDIGFHDAGFTSSICIDNNKDACQSLEGNKVSDNIICDDISNVSNKRIRDTANIKPKKIDLVIGGPPCPAFSKSRFYRKEMTHGTDDPSFDTIREYFRVLEHFQPNMFVMENVHTFAAKRQKGALEFVYQEAEKLGYTTQHRVLNAADYGAPQKRERIFIVGCRNSLSFSFPEKTHANPEKSDLLETELPPWRTAGDAIANLDSDENDYDLPGHFAGGKHHDLLREIPPGDNYLYFTEKRGHKNPLFKWRSRYWSFLLKLSPDMPSWTIQARRSNNMGPFHWRNRILTIAEVARLQTFPDNFWFHGTIEKQWRQIGNAVPPVLALSMAEEVKRALSA